MANRFERGMVFDANLQWHAPEFYTPNFEAWAGVLADNQGKLDATNTALNAMRPDALTEHQDEAGQYYQEWQEKSNNLAEVYSTQGVAAGNRMRNQLLRNVRDEIANPNSKFNTFGNIKKQYMAEVERLNEFHEKDPVQDNKMFSVHQLRSQLDEDFSSFYDDENKVPLKSINPVNAIAYQDIGGEMWDFASKVQVDGETIMQENGKWLTTQSRKEVPAHRVEALFNSFITDPKYRGQMRAHLFARSQATNPQDYAASNNQNITAYTQGLKEELAGLKKNLSSKDKEERQLGQRKLLSMGYKIGKDDGDVGTRTQKGLDAFEKQVNEAILEQSKGIIQDPNNFGDAELESALHKDMIRSYKDGFKNFFGSDTSFTFKANPYDLLWRRHQYASKRQADYLSFLGQSFIPPSDTSKLNEDIATPLDTRFYESKKETEELINSSQQILDAQLNSPDLTGIVGKNLSQAEMNKVVKAYRQANKTPGMSFDDEVFADELSKAGVTGLSPESYSDLVSYLTNDGAKNYVEALNSLENNKKKLGVMDDYEEGITQQYRQTIGDRNWRNFKASNPTLANLSDEQAVAKANELKKLHDEYNSVRNQIKKEIVQNTGRQKTQEEKDIRNAKLDKLKTREKELENMMGKDKRLAFDYKQFEKREVENVNEAILQNPELYKSNVNYRLTNEDKKTIVGQSLSQVKHSFNTGDGVGFDGASSKNITWLDSSYKPTKTTNGEVEVIDVGYGLHEGKPAFVLSGKVRGTSESRRGVAIMTDAQKNNERKNIKSVAFTAMKSGDRKKAEAWARILQGMDGEENVTEINLIDTTPLDIQNAESKTFILDNREVEIDNVAPNPITEYEVDGITYEVYKAQPQGRKSKTDIYYLNARLEHPTDPNLVANRLVKVDMGDVITNPELKQANYSSFDEVDMQIRLLRLSGDPEVRVEIETPGKRETANRLMGGQIPLGFQQGIDEGIEELELDNQ